MFFYSVIAVYIVVAVLLYLQFTKVDDGQSPVIVAMTALVWLPAMIACLVYDLLVEDDTVNN